MFKGLILRSHPWLQLGHEQHSPGITRQQGYSSLLTPQFPQPAFFFRVALLQLSMQLSLILSILFCMSHCLLQKGDPLSRLKATPVYGYNRRQFDNISVYHFGKANGIMHVVILKQAP